MLFPFFLLRYKLRNSDGANAARAEFSTQWLTSLLGMVAMLN